MGKIRAIWYYFSCFKYAVGHVNPIDQQAEQFRKRFGCHQYRYGGDY